MHFCIVLFNWNSHNYHCYCATAVFGLVSPQAGNSTGVEILDLGWARITKDPMYGLLDMTVYPCDYTDVRERSAWAR